mmetsp:Transcript_18885/g.37108  ORF Transcript_18885/g.37108 Transcript_18885/m.37108 type:complete len:174 (-) Transcript_18885:276-797(-)
MSNPSLKKVSRPPAPFMPAMVSEGGLLSSKAASPRSPFKLVFVLSSSVWSHTCPYQISAARAEALEVELKVSEGAVLGRAEVGTYPEKACSPSGPRSRVLEGRGNGGRSHGASVVGYQGGMHACTHPCMHAERALESSSCFEAQGDAPKALEERQRVGHKCFLDFLGPLNFVR